MSLTSADVKKRYNLETYLKFRYSNVVLLSLLDAQTLMDLGQDPQAMHIQNAPSLPPGGPTRYNDYLYGKFENPQGLITYIGLPWINPTTLQEITGLVHILTIRGASSDQIESLRSMLPTILINDFDITTK